MLRLRTTTTLSLLALAVGIAGTQWLSGQGAGWTGPSERVAGFMHATAAVTRPARRVRHEHVAQRVTRSVPRAVTAIVAVAAPIRHRNPPIMVGTGAANPAPPPELVPVVMPPSAVSWSRMRDHLVGNVQLHLVVDGAGEVTAAGLAQSSGDPILDAHALATVRSWRFAVPPDHPDGLSGELTMRFTGASPQLVQAP